MIKVVGDKAYRENIPTFLSGLNASSLLDLSWTDPALGVQNCAWWPEVDESKPLGENEKYGAETLTPDPQNKVVRVVRQVVPMSEEEVAAKQAPLGDTGTIMSRLIELETAAAALRAELEKQQ